MPRVLGVVTDPRARHYWDEQQAVMRPYHERYDLVGPCAGIFMIFGPDAKWDDAGPLIPDYAEDAHAREFDRRLPQWNAKRFAARALEMINR